MPEKQEQLEWEARAGRVAAVGAFLAAIAPIASAVALNAMLPSRLDTDAEHVKALADHSGAFWAGAVIASAGSLAFILPLLYLLRASRNRIDAPRWIDPLIVIGPVLLLLAGLLGLADLISRAQDALPVTEKQAEDVIRHAAPGVVGLTAAGSLAAGVGIIMTATYGGRAGLLSRFMSVMGIIVGALMLVGFLLGAASLGGPIIVFWGIALGMLFLGRWPGGRGPAWETGEAIPWPSAQERYAPAQEEDEAGEPEPEPEPEPARSQPNPNASRKRRKKKARR
ncbi:MAG TPA: hypothetical protein VF066_03360 [Thermoleophilaceae bacterium]